MPTITTTGSVTSQLWLQTPAHISSLKFWIDASDLSSMFTDTGGTTPVTSDGDLVARINDKSGNNLYVTQSNSARRPIYRAVSAQRAPSWAISGTRTMVSTNAVNFAANAQQHTVIIAGKRDTTSGSLGCFINATSGSYWFMGSTSADQYKFYTNGAHYVMNGDGLNFTVLMMNKTSTTNMRILRSGTFIQNLAVGDYGGWGNYFSVFGYEYGSNACTGDVCEIMVYTKSLSLKEEVLLNNYLARKYGLSYRDQPLADDYLCANHTTFLTDDSGNELFWR